MSTREFIRAALAMVAVSVLAGCATVPERARANGRPMTQGNSYQRAIRGDMTLQTQRMLRGEADPLRLLRRDVPYRPFTHWPY